MGMMWKFLLGMVLIGFIPVVTSLETVLAQIPIGELQNQAPGITISGTVTSVVGNNFVLNDETGEIIVDAGPRWWREINVVEGEQLTVTGELGRSGELDAFTVMRRDGTVIDIRPAQGPPPWAGGPNRHRSSQPSQ
jgi:hypothetical protein